MPAGGVDLVFRLLAPGFRLLETDNWLSVWKSYRFYLLHEVEPVLVNEGWTKISFRNQVAWLRRRRSWHQPFARNTKDGPRATHCIGDANKFESLGHPREIELGQTENFGSPSTICVWSFGASPLRQRAVRHLTR